MSALQATRGREQGQAIRLRQRVDIELLIGVALLIALGLAMVASSSISIAERLMDEPLYYFERQAIYVLAGIAAMALMCRIRLAYWESAGPALLLCALLLLVLVLVPGIGYEVNGSSRWLPLGPVNLQVSELAKLLVIIYLAGYLVRHGVAVRDTLRGFCLPIGVLALVSALLLLEPDYGAAVVLVATALGMLFVGGVRLTQFALLLIVAVGSLGLLAVNSSYRMERLTAFLNPWADPFNSGFQLTQSLIAIGSGGWFGVGLGGSIQKLFYLPEAHTDFLFAVLAEELGLTGIVIVLALYTWLLWRTFAIGSEAQRRGMRFAAFLCYGIGIWLGLQAFINMGVNLGILPTKGLTLPLMSYGGSSMLVMCAAVGLLLRVHRETVDDAAMGRDADGGYGT